MRKRKIAMALCMVSLLSIGLAGCSNSDNPLMSKSKKELVELVGQYEQRINDLNTQVQDLTKQVEGTRGEVVESAAIREFADGTGRLTLTSVNDIVTLPTPFEYPYSSQASNSSAIEIGENIKIRPTGNWIVRVDGTKVELQHEDSGITGVITIGNTDQVNLDNAVSASDLTEYMNTFFESLPPSEITYQRLYINNDWFGMDARTSTYVDEKDARLRCGMLGYGEVCLTYLFAYSGEENSANEETILTLLQTLTVYDNQLRIE